MAFCFGSFAPSGDAGAVGMDLSTYARLLARTANGHDEEAGCPNRGPRGGRNAAKPVVAPPCTACVGIGDCICICNLVSTGFPKKEKAYYVHHHHRNSMDHLGNVNKFWEM